MTLLVFILAAGVFLAGGLAGALVTLAVGIHCHARQDKAGNPGTAVEASRRILGVGPSQTHSRS